MIIRPKESSNRVKFHDIKEGETFRVVECDCNIIWMKIRSIISIYNDNYNAVDLSDGALEFFKDDDFITPVKVTAVEE